MFYQSFFGGCLRSQGPGIGRLIIGDAGGGSKNAQKSQKNTIFGPKMTKNGQKWPKNAKITAFLTLFWPKNRLSAP